MKVIRTNRARVATALSLSTVVAGAVVYLQAAPQLRFNRTEPPPVASTGDGFTADVTVEQAVVDSNGTERRGMAPRSSYQVERARVASRWRTSVTLMAVDQATAVSDGVPRALTNPFLVTRLEYDEGTPAPRMYNGRGDRVDFPGDAERQLLSVPVAMRRNWDPNGASDRIRAAAITPDGSSWVESLVLPSSGRQRRRAALERRFGRPSGRVRGLDRYVGTMGNVTNEMLVSPELVLPVEINNTLGRDLVSRTLMTHELQPNGLVVRRRLRTEQSARNARGERPVVYVEVGNARVLPSGVRQ